MGQLHVVNGDDWGFMFVFLGELLFQWLYKKLYPSLLQLCKEFFFLKQNTFKNVSTYEYIMKERGNRLFEESR